MRFSSALFLAGSALAVSRRECILTHNADLAAYADCGYEGAIAFCFSLLDSFADADVRRCYTDSGCSPAEADVEARYTLDRCDELDRSGELRKRYRAADILPRATTSEAGNAPGLPYKTGSVCFKSGTKSTTECPLTTDNGHVKSVTCFPTVVTTSECAPNLVCTIDDSQVEICMDAHNSLDTAGIIIAIVFGIIITLGVGVLTFLCCKDRSDQKRLAAKAEAVALARAATKKQRNTEQREQRTPLIRNASAGSTNPFQDQPPRV